mmetsp:Transcript_10212/g.14070  ORF Transcript_10212/g.14070 Transcript_10212/m.14070 type:complete len:389 (+) Transcript_10212:325-1491(+)|eukprot:CAMPEP_0185277442 /NCGR_PEP_ID=MMETSP1359-20130426/58603_1 /TAXON_ID=552665 /ORGANISM="Bigelowiella longifila, Strain CCMP242" /LENGTH=388 /DNA_ID=CAMNT_0027871551 /DNA_START=241 /DNA_END=1407 /DNA_ORIENTATION=+
MDYILLRLFYVILFILPTSVSPSSSLALRPSKNPIAPPPPLQVIGVGAEYSGTDTLKFALKQLGFELQYDIERALLDPSHNNKPINSDEHMRMWKMAAASKESFMKFGGDGIFNGWDSAVGWPLSLFPEELVEQFPHSKFVLTTLRDPKSWYRRINQTICIFRKPELWFVEIVKNIPMRAFRRMSVVQDFMSSLIAERFMFLHSDEQFWTELCDNEEAALRAYERWNTKIIDIIPNDRLLVLETIDDAKNESSGMSSYYESLRYFLQVDNSSSTLLSSIRSNNDVLRKFQSLKQKFKAYAIATLLLPVVVVLVFSWFVKREIQDLMMFDIQHQHDINNEKHPTQGVPKASGSLNTKSRKSEKMNQDRGGGGGKFQDMDKAEAYKKKNK